MKTVVALTLSILAFTLVERPSPVFIDGKSFGNAINIRGIIAISVADFANGIAGTPDLQRAGFHIQGNKLMLLPAVQRQAIVSPRDAASGQASGKRMHKPFTITKEWDSATPLIQSNGKLYIALSDVAKAFGGALTANQTLTPGLPINLNFAPSPAAAIGSAQ